MKKTIILLAGYPATGKSYLCNKILEQNHDFEVLSQDEMKEKLWDEYGFNNMEEKNELEKKSWNQYYEVMDQKMKDGIFLISDYPFSDKQKDKIATVAKKNKYQVITIRLTGDIEFLYNRSKGRDLDSSRHLGHLVSCYHKGDILEDRSKADCIVTKEIFFDRCMNRGYDKFQLGKLIEIDVTDIRKINYPQILKELAAMLE
ncbi:MAG: AAA family ATPase [Anaerostipes sp.]|nr:AAA family ATPase [Anaerostipes sp.]